MATPRLALVAALSIAVLLNSRTWNVEPSEAMGWASRTPGPLSLLEDAAKSGFAILLGLAFKAQKHALPMKLDY